MRYDNSDSVKCKVQHVHNSLLRYDNSDSVKCEVQHLRTSLLRYDNSDSVSLRSVTAHFPLICVAGSVST